MFTYIYRILIEYTDIYDYIYYCRCTSFSSDSRSADSVVHHRVPRAGANRDLRSEVQSNESPAIRQKSKGVCLFMQIYEYLYRIVDFLLTKIYLLFYLWKIKAG